MNTAKIYPYIVSQSYLEHGAIAVRTLIDGEIYLSLVEDLDGIVQGITPEALGDANLSAEQALDLALDNLGNALRNQEINISSFDGENGDMPFLLFADSWLAAAALVERGLSDFAANVFGTNSVYASIPHRDAMLVFPKCTGGKLQAYRDMIVEHESDGEKPLTFTLFEISPEGVRAVE